MQRFVITRVGPKKKGRTHNPNRLYQITDLRTGDNVEVAHTYEAALARRRVIELEAIEKERVTFPAPLTKAGWEELRKENASIVAFLTARTEMLKTEEIDFLRQRGISEHHYAHLIPQLNPEEDLGVKAKHRAATIAYLGTLIEGPISPALIAECERLEVPLECYQHLIAITEPELADSLFDVETMPEE